MSAILVKRTVVAAFGAAVLVWAPDAQAQPFQAPAVASSAGVVVSRTVEEAAPTVGIRIGQRFDARHVIGRLLHRADLQRFGQVGPAPFAGPGFYGPHFVMPEIGNLSLVSVAMIADATPESAPVYTVTIRNDGKCDAHGFRATLAAVLGEIHEFSPVVVASVPKLPAGAEVQIEMQLPFASMAMDSGNRARPFDTLVAAIDSFDEILERDECDNILVLRREAVAIVVTTVVAEAAAPVEVAPSLGPAVGEGPAMSGPASQAPAEEIPPSVAPAPETPAPGPDGQPPHNPVDIDNIDLPPAENAAFLFDGE